MGFNHDEPIVSCECLQPPVRSDTAKVRLVTLQDLQNVRLKARQVTDENRNLCSPKKDVVQVKV